MIRLFFFLFAALLVQLPLGTKVNAEVELFICQNDAIGGQKWKRVSILQLASILRGDEAELELKVRRAICNDTMTSASCAALSGKMFCRQSALERINLVATWYAYEFIDGGFDSYESFHNAFGRPLEKAYRYADGAEPSDKVTAVLEPMLAILEQKLQGKGLVDVPDELRKVAAIQNRIVAFNLAALVGHETHHLNNEICPVQKKSRMEISGLFDHILDVQTSNRLFCASYPNPNEIKADRCAARQIEQLHSDPIKGWSDDEVFEAFAERAASDMIAFQSLTGFRRFGQLPIGQYAIPHLDAYLNPVFRLALLSGSVSTISSEPQLCGGAASLFVHGVQVSFQQCGGNGKVSDELLTLVPPGVEKSWNGLPWSAKSFSCNEQ